MDVLTPGDKRALLRATIEAHHPVLVETGIYQGGASGMGMADILARYLVCDIDPANTGSVQAECPWAEVWTGDSGQVMELMLRTLERPAVFWLDAHYVADLDGEKMEEHPCPLLPELAAIRSWPHAAASVVLVDDVRLLGSPGWPTGEQVRGALELWRVEERDDVLRAYPS